MDKPSNHWENLHRSTSFIGQSYFPPFTTLALDSNLKEIFEEFASADQGLVEDKLLEVMPSLNHEQLVKLGLFLAFDGNINSKAVWREWEVLVTDAAHRLSVEQVCQANWASIQQKPKHTTAQFNKMLFQMAFDRIDNCPLEDLLHIM
jgi:hypothetical protein